MTAPLKIIFFVLILFTCRSAGAQYTLTAAGQPASGDIMQMIKADSSGVTTGSAGTGQVWNYTGIAVSQTAAVNSGTFVQASSTPSGSAFSANLAIDRGNSNYDYYTWGPSSKTYEGYATATSTVAYTDPLTYYTLPFSYGSVSNDNASVTFTISGPSTATVVLTETISTTADGTGTLNMPGGRSYANVLRLKTTEQVYQNIASLGLNEYYIANTYDYYGSVSKFPILTIAVTNATVTQSSGTTYHYSKNVYVNSIQVTGIEEQSRPEFGIAPNPSPLNYTVSVNLGLKEKGAYRIAVYDAMGRELRCLDLGIQPAGELHTGLSTEGLSPGLYYMKLQGNNTESVQKLLLR